MISLRYLQMEKRDVTKEEVKGFRINLEEATKKTFIEYDRAKRRALELSNEYYLD